MRIQCWSIPRPRHAPSQRWLAKLLSLFFCLSPIVLFASSEPARLSGAFIQFVHGMEQWGTNQWHPIMQSMHEAKLDTVILQMTAQQNADGSIYHYIPTGTANSDGIGTIFAYANEHHMSVVLGLFLNSNNGGSGSTTEAFLTQAAQDNIAIANRAYARYFSNGAPRSFAGWYLPQETWTGNYSDAEISAINRFFRDTSAACKKLSPAPVFISPFISSERPAAAVAGQIYARILTNSGIDVVMLQDSVGAHLWDSNIMSNTEPYFREFRAACDQTGVTLWANVESYQLTTGQFEPCTFERLRHQIGCASRHTSRMITFDFFHYMNPVVRLSWWNSSRVAAMAALYTQYKSNLVDRDFIPEPALKIQAITHGVNGPSLIWNSQTGVTYSVASAPRVDSPIWEIRATNRTATNVWSEGATERTNRFYRLEQSPLHPIQENMIWMPPGTFLMGSPDTETSRRANEGPQTQVTLTQGFWISRLEVTQAEYQNVCRTNPSLNRADLSLPVENVTWLQASNYCSQLNWIEAQAGRLPAGWEYRLPTEVEWEYAARAGTTSAYFFGAATNGFELYGWFKPNATNSTHIVGERPANAWGLQDMSGNVMEWCWNALTTYPGGAVTNFQGPAQGATRMVRGGSWNRPVVNGRSAWREEHLPNIKYADLGFRVVLAPLPK